jgi:hypothetical protein
MDDFIIITNSNEYYASSLISSNFPSELKEKALKYLYTSCGHNRIKTINKCIQSLNYKKDNVIGFGDDEKDALIYTNVEIKYYLVNNDNGYDSADIIREKIIEPKDVSFRNEFMYDIIEMKGRIYSGFNSRYFDDIVVYYCRYYNPNFGIRHHPIQQNKKEYGIIDSSEMADWRGGKTGYVKTHLLELFNNEYRDFNNLENAIFAKVPSHDEVVLKNDKPCNYILKEFNSRYGYIIYPDLLLKNRIVEQKHGSMGKARNCCDDYESTIINPNRNIKGKTIYLFDDIVTSGSTMMACVQRLYEAGAGHVVCFCIARTLPGLGYGLNHLDGEVIYGN